MDTTADNRLALDEERRIRQHDHLRSELEADVDRRISTEAKQGLASEPRIEQVADELRQKTIREVEQSERDLAAVRTAARVNQVVDSCFYVIYSLLGLRFLLALIGANNNAGFVRFIKSITQPFYLPFKNIVASPTLAENGSTLAAPILIAIVVYLMLQAGIRGLLRLIAQRRTQL